MADFAFIPSDIQPADIVWCNCEALPFMMQ
jgi:hypothetical protein